MNNRQKTMVRYEGVRCRYLVQDVRVADHDEEGLGSGDGNVEP